MNKVVLLIFLSICFSQFSVKDGKAYNIIDNQYYSDEVFINFLNIESKF